MFILKKVICKMKKLGKKYVYNNETHSFEWVFLFIEMR